MLSATRLIIITVSLFVLHFGLYLEGVQITHLQVKIQNNHMDTGLVKVWYLNPHCISIDNTEPDIQCS